MLSQVPGTSPPRVRLCDRVRVTPLPRRLRRLTCNIWFERNGFAWATARARITAPTRSDISLFNVRFAITPVFPGAILSDVTWLEDGLRQRISPDIKSRQSRTPQTMNACLVDSKEAAPCLRQGKPAQKLAPFAGHQKSRTLAAAPVEEPNQPSSRRIGDRIWVNGLSVSRGY
jgi:hypothetical protein